jgi:AMP-polyphosphate phosphotransferase
MLEHIDLDQSVSKDEYKRRLEPLQQRLYDLQGAVFRARVPVAIVFEGWAAAGKGSTINVLAARLDPRGFRVVPVTPPRTAEQAYPWLWRFWLKIPAYGQMVVYDTSWYRRVLIDRITQQVSRAEWQAAYQDIADFEAQLAADGAVILKFWLHITKHEQAKRFKKLRANKLTAWQVSDEDDAQHTAYKHYLEAVEEMLSRTEAPHAPWTIVAATDRYFTRLKVMETIVQSLEFHIGPLVVADDTTPSAPAPELNAETRRPAPPAPAASSEKAAEPGPAPEPAAPTVVLTAPRPRHRAKEKGEKAHA